MTLHTYRLNMGLLSTIYFQPHSKIAYSLSTINKWILLWLNIKFVFVSDFWLNDAHVALTRSVPLKHFCKIKSDVMWCSPSNNSAGKSFLQTATHQMERCTAPKRHAQQLQVLLPSLLLVRTGTHFINTLFHSMVLALDIMAEANWKGIFCSHKLHFFGNNF